MMGPAVVEFGVRALRRIPEYNGARADYKNFWDLRGAAMEGALQVPFFQDLCVVRDVAGDDVGQRTHGEEIVAGDACPRPRFPG